MIRPLILTLLIATPAFAQSGPMTPLPAYTVTGVRPAAAATASIIGSNGAPMGSADFYQGPKGVLVSLSVSGLSPGWHGVHFHWTGQCDAAGKFASAQHHMGLNDGPHGYLQSKGPHAGDLPNIMIAADGTGAAEFYIDMVRVSGTGKPRKGIAVLMDADGSSIIIHEKQDDHFTQPSGGAAARMACGVLQSR